MNEWRRVERGIKFRENKDGTRSYMVDLAVKGRPRIRQVVGTALSEARDRRAELRLEESRLDKDEPGKPRRIRLSAFIDIYIDDYLSVSASKSLKGEKNRLENIKKKLGDKFLDSYTTGDIERMLAGLRRKTKNFPEGRSAGTVNRYRSRLLSLFNKAMDWDFIEFNPVARVKRLKEHQKGDRYLMNGELKELLDKCDKDLRPLVHMAALTGIRQGALLKIDWSDVEPDLAFVTLRGETTKTNEPRRVPLVPEARTVLEGMGGWRPKGSLFGFENFPKKRWDDVIKNMKWNVTENPRLHKFRFHDLRHHAASQMVMGGMSLAQVGKVLGHSQLQTTMRYAHFADDRLAEDMERAFEKFSNTNDLNGKNHGKRELEEK